MSSSKQQTIPELLDALIEAAEKAGEFKQYMAPHLDKHDYAFHQNMYKVEKQVVDAFKTAIIALIKVS